MTEKGEQEPPGIVPGGVETAADLAIQTTEQATPTPGQLMERTAAWAYTAASTSETHTAGPTPLSAVAQLVRGAEHRRTQYAGTIVLNSEIEKLTLVGQLGERLHRTQPQSAGSTPSQRLLLVAANHKAALALARERDTTVLARVAPSCSVSGLREYPTRQSATADILAVGRERLQGALDSGAVDPTQFGLVVYDSGREPAAADTLAIIGNRLGHTSCVHVMASSTPDTSPRPSAPSSPLQVLHQETLADAIRGGVVNGAQLFSLRVPLKHGIGSSTNKEAMMQYEDNYNSLVTDAVVELVESGRRVAVYCQAGGEQSAHARQLIKLLSLRTVSTGIDELTDTITTRPVTAKLASSKYQKESEYAQTIRDFNAGNLDVLLATFGLEEGGGIYPDALVIANDVRRPQFIHNLLANAVTPNPRFPVTVLIEFFPLRTGQPGRTLSFQEAFGHTTIKQGVMLGGYLDQLTSTLPPEVFQLPPSLQQLAASIDGVQTLPATRLRTSEAALTACVPFSEILADWPGYYPASVRRALSEAGYKPVVRRQGVGGARRGWPEYEPAARAYLHEYPLPPLPLPGEMTGTQIATMFNAYSDDVYDKIIASRERLRLESNSRYNPFGGAGRGTARYLTEDSVRRFVTEYFDPPEAEPSDISLGALDETLGCGPAFIEYMIAQHGLQAAPKWARPPLAGCYLHLDETGANTIVRNYLQLSEAGPSDVPLARYRRTKMKISTLLERMAPYAKSIQFKRTPGQNTAMPYVRESVAVVIDAAYGLSSAEKVEEVVTPPAVEPIDESDEPLTDHSGWGYMPRTTRGQRAKKVESAFIPIKSALPPEILQKAQTAAVHRPEEPGSWQPTTAAAGHFISVTEALTAAEIAERLEISEEAVRSALQRIAFNGEAPADGIYRGPKLLLLREQLLGIPLEYLSRYLGIAEDRIVTDLEGAGYQATSENRYSPGARHYLLQRIPFTE